MEGVRERVEGGADELVVGVGREYMLLLLRNGLWVRELLLLLPCVCVWGGGKEGKRKGPLLHDVRALKRSQLFKSLSCFPCSSGHGQPLVLPFFFVRLVGSLLSPLNLCYTPK